MSCRLGGCKLRCCQNQISGYEVNDDHLLLTAANWYLRSRTPNSEELPQTRNHVANDTVISTLNSELVILWRASDPLGTYYISSPETSALAPLKLVLSSSSIDQTVDLYYSSSCLSGFRWHMYTFASDAPLNYLTSFHRHDDWFMQAWKSNPYSRRFNKRIASRNYAHDTSLIENLKLGDTDGMLLAENLKLSERHDILLTRWWQTR